MKNYIKVGLLAFVFIFSIASFGHWLGGRQGALFGFIIALGLMYIIYIVGNQLALSYFTSQHIEGQDSLGLCERLRRISALAKIPMPKLYMIPNAFPTAFTCGMTARGASIFITKGLTNVLSPDEVEAVLAQQLATIKRNDLLPAMVGAVLATAFLSITDNQSHVKNTNPITSFLFSIFAPFALVAVHLHVSRRSYSENDLLASQWLSNPLRLAEALIKLDSYAKTQPPEVPYSLSHLFIVNPLTRYGWGRLFAIQPPIAKRIRRLVGYYPI